MSLKVLVIITIIETTIKWIGRFDWFNQIFDEEQAICLISFITTTNNFEKYPNWALNIPI